MELWGGVPQDGTAAHPTAVAHGDRQQAILHISDICPISRLRNIVKTILSETPMIRYQKYKVQFKVRGPRPEEPFISSSRRPSISFSDFDLLPGKTLTDEIRRTGRVNL